MPRYLVERTFQEDFRLPGPSDAGPERQRFLENNTLMGVVWLYSYVSSDRKKSYCLYDAPTPEALRRAAQQNDIPIDRILEVNRLDPYGFAD